MDGIAKAGHLGARELGTSYRAREVHAAAACQEAVHASAQTCVHYAGQLCQCAWCALFSAASCSSVPRRLPTSGGSLETSFQAAHCGANHPAQLRLVRPQDHVEQMLVGHHVLEPLSLLLVGHFVELLVDWHASVDRLVDVDALWRFPVTNWCGSAVVRMGILLLADGGSQVCRSMVEIGLLRSSDGQQTRPTGPDLRRSGLRLARRAAEQVWFVCQHAVCPD